jgi:hypothetical protein
MKILLAVDGSIFSQAAAESVAKRLLPPDSEIKILTVIEPFQPYMTEVWAISAGYWDDQDKLAKALADDNLTRAMNVFQASENKSLLVTTEVITGNPKG